VEVVNLVRGNIVQRKGKKRAVNMETRIAKNKKREEKKRIC